MEALDQPRHHLGRTEQRATDTWKLEAGRWRITQRVIDELSKKGAKVILAAHFGRPKGERVSTMSVSMTLDAVQAVLGKEVMFVPEVAGPVVAQAVGILGNGAIACLENTRFWPGEEKNDPDRITALFRKTLQSFPFARDSC